MNKSDSFADLGFVPISSSTEERPVKAFTRAAAKGALGSYGNVLEAVGLRPSARQLPGQKLRQEAERKAKPTDIAIHESEDIIPEYYRPPTSEDVEKTLEDLGIPKEERSRAEKILGRFGRLLGEAAPLGPGGLVSALGGTTLGQAAEELGLGPQGEAIGEIGGALAQPISGAVKALRGAPAKMKSGLTKLRAVDTKFPRVGRLTAEKQTAAIKKLNQEASDLAKTSFQKHVPISEKIKEGFDFEKRFENRFGEVQKLARKANPEIDIKDLSSFFNTKAKDYRGIPKLHSEGQKVVNEIKAFQRNPRTSLNDLLKIYRSNNKKISNTYEKSRLLGTQKEYTDFLIDYNRRIADSFKNTLPKNSPFVRMFEDTNREFKNYRDAIKTEATLKPLLGDSPTPANITKFAEDPRLQKRLALSMGQEGANEIIDIAKDLQTATNTVKNIPTRELQKFHEAFSLAYFLPVPYLLKAGLAVNKAAKLASRGYGAFLTTSAKQSSYKDALKALKSGNLNAYVQATNKLSKELGEEDTFEDLGFVPIR